MGATNGEDDFVIMDNGVIELGKAMAFQAVIEAADIVQADCIIMPDVVGDYKATRKAVEAEWEIINNCDYSIMKVPQGDTDKELIQCVEWLAATFPRDIVDYWGIPRCITNNARMGSRAPIIDYINNICLNAQIHLLGMSDNFKDDIECSKKYHVMGIDSANPIILGLMNVSINELWSHTSNSRYVHPKRGNYWEAEDINYNVLRNIRH
ncbi:MAG: hypothetical protein QQN63_14425, partial [Nitrosopumilus sp.]